MKKRWLSFTLALVMLLILLPVAASAAEISGECGEAAIWNFSDGTLTISGEGLIKNYASPSSTVPWSDLMAEITTVIIEEGITGGGEHAFFGCTNLRSVSLPDTLTQIGGSMFRDCSSLSAITIPEGVTSIGPCAFSSCSSLSEINIPSTVTTIGYYAFSDIDSLTCVILPEGVTTLEHCVFSNCNNLHSVVIPLSMQTMSREWVTNCDSLENIYYPGTQEQWGAIKLTFADLTADQENPTLANATIHYGYTAIGSCGEKADWNFADGVLTVSGEGAVDTIPWENQKDLITSVTLENGITSICASAFENCTFLESVTIPASVETISEAAFAGCTGLKDIYFTGDAPSYICAEDPMASFHNVTATVYYPENNETWTEKLMQDYGGTLTWVSYTPAADEIFTDVVPGAYYIDAVTWAVGNGITNGITPTTFDPEGLCTRAQVVTFLWRSQGSPAPTSTENPFEDVVQGEHTSWYYDAVLWAVENGITNGRDDTHFAPDGQCLRSEVVMFLWRTAKNPASSLTENPFRDTTTEHWFYDPVMWAVGEGITTGVEDDLFGPDEKCTRAQIVTFLYRYIN